MDTNNWRPTQGGEPAMDAGDWRSQLQPDCRQRIVNKIMETLKRHLPVSGNEGLSELRKISVRFEEKIYTAATSKTDYLRKISLKMLTMETRSQNSVGSSWPLDSGEASTDNQRRQVDSQQQQLHQYLYQQELQQQMFQQGSIPRNTLVQSHTQPQRQNLIQLLSDLSVISSEPLP